jgi:hypothetical protein
MKPEAEGATIHSPEVAIAGAGSTRGLFITPAPADIWVGIGFGNGNGVSMAMESHQVRWVDLHMNNMSKAVLFKLRIRSAFLGSKLSYNASRSCLAVARAMKRSCQSLK